jgi:hypothetical protein
MIDARFAIAGLATMTSMTAATTTMGACHTSTVGRQVGSPPEWKRSRTPWSKLARRSRVDGGIDPCRICTTSIQMLGSRQSASSACVPFRWAR